MLIGDRLQALRKERNLSQGDIEKRTGLLRCYLSRVEHGRTVPSFGTLERLAHAFKVPLYQLFYEGDEPPKLANLPRRVSVDDLWGASGPQARLLVNFQKAFGRKRNGKKSMAA
jgi:transcriptional regulator with XRE-family HTH domain